MKAVQNAFCNGRKLPGSLTSVLRLGLGANRMQLSFADSD
jgi:hypothetical protein